MSIPTAPAGQFCTHALSERNRLGWDVDEHGWAICRGCSKPSAQSVRAAEQGTRAAPFIDSAAVPGDITAAGVAGRGRTSVLIVTTNDVPGYRIDEVHGDVFGLVVRARNVLSNWGASLRTVVGGEVHGYTKLLSESRNEARTRLADEARALGANAVVAMRFDCNEIGDIMSEVAAYGTAVTISKVSDISTTNA